MHVLAASRVTVSLIKATNIGRVLSLASRRAEFGGAGVYGAIGDQINAILATWKGIVEAYVAEIGLV